jgi:hypothetical protein
MASLYDITKGEGVELDRILSQAGFDAEMAKTIIGQPQLADVMMAALREQLQPIRFDRYQQFLMPLDRQLDCLLGLDAKVWNSRVTNAGWFDGLSTVSDHEQTVEDLEFFWVSFGSLDEDLRLHWQAIAAKQRVPNDGGLYIKTNDEHARLHHTARTYAPGIHRVRINLLANWEPQNGRSVTQVREQVPGGQWLAQAETLGAYETHYELLRETDGENLPRPDLAGIEYRYPGDRDFKHCPCVIRSGDKFGLSAAWTGNVAHGWSAPVVLGVEE